ncbi:alpha-galactosidase [Mollicutes bacterium LVI A0078]|nr:alpha-galactosidase [Mollicutes bacterium LVI A0075]WOO90380.1 alpha-galactosidase [Mollicutes bacterium LVI A0078]
MNIIYDETNKIFHLNNEKISYVLKVMRNGELGQLYYGQKLVVSDLEHLYYEKDVPTVCVFEKEQQFSMSNMRQEYSSFGGTDFSVGCYNVEQENGSNLTEFKYSSYEVLDQKPRIPNLPQSEGKSKTLKITMIDTLINARLELYYSIFENSSCIVRSARFINEGEQKLFLDKALSFQLDFDDLDFKMVQLDGAWARERNVTYRDVKQGRTIIESTMGATSHVQNPFLCLLKSDANESHGEVYASTLIYSGSFIGSIDVASHERVRMSMGIHPQNFKWELTNEQDFWTPEAVLNYSPNGLNDLSQEYHNFIKDNVMRLKPKVKRTKFLTNNWEATYFDFDGPQIIDIAKEAKKCGAEMFVLDDGWFGTRNDDTSSLGDWQTNEQKLKMSLAELSTTITGMGLDFGIWIEPEMISKRSKLYEEHPQYAIQTPNRYMSYGRQQFVLDFANPEVVQYIFDMLCVELDRLDFQYIKWDMNRNITEGYSSSLGIHNQGEFLHRYILGVYKLYELLQEKYPDVMIEACAGGGGRFDLGMLYYSPQIWTSDDSDPVERLKIQWGTSMLYPLHAIVNHVSAVKNHQTGRETNLDFKASVAYFGNFGYEINFSELNEKEKQQIEKQMKFYDKYQDVFLKGKFYRLESPFDGNTNHVSMMAEYQGTIVVGAYNLLYRPNAPIRRIKLQGLDAGKIYVDQDGIEYSGAYLMNTGYFINNNICGTDRFEYEAVGESDFSSSIIIFNQK